MFILWQNGHYQELGHYSAKFQCMKNKSLWYALFPPKPESPLIKHSSWNHLPPQAEQLPKRPSYPASRYTYNNLSVYLFLKSKLQLDKRKEIKNQGIQVQLKKALKSFCHQTPSISVSLLFFGRI